MADEDRAGRAGNDPNAALFAAALGAAAGAKNIDTLIARQIALADLQIEDIRREDKLRHWSLWVRHTSDVMKLTFELALAFIVVAVAALICTMVWQAEHDNSLVIEAFSVPPDMAARGLTGQAVAAQVQDKLSEMQAATQTARPADSYTGNWGNDIKVQIPDTGVSVSDVYRLLASWLGHQTHITGEVYRTAQDIAITVRATGNPGDTARGSEADLDGLIQKAAETIYARTQPYRYAIYIVGVSESNGPKTYAIWQHLAQTGSPLDQAWSYMGIGTYAESADPLHAPEIQRKAIPIVPDFALAYQNIADEELNLGHDEAALANTRKAANILAKSDGGLNATAHDISLLADRQMAEDLNGNFTAAWNDDQQISQMPDYANISHIAAANRAIDEARLHDTSAGRSDWGGLPAPLHPRVALFRTIFEIQLRDALGDWRQVLHLQADVTQRIGIIVRHPPFAPRFVAPTLQRRVWPYGAEALAHLGNMAGALPLIAKTPRDCYDCVRVRGKLDTMRGNWNGAAYWFARAAALAPSIPFAYADWGAMLLAKGDLDGAIEKFAMANQKGPHFADPLEMWGEALIVKSRSDLALAKFAEADKYAPNWGRLHLKWGEALWWSGDRQDARKQFAIASHLDLTPSEKSQLARVGAAHG